MAYNLKDFLIAFLFVILCDDLISQTKIKIGDQEENVYSLDLNRKDLDNELLPLKDLFTSKEIVGMGEATHGTKEFFDLKAKTFKFLVTSCNYRIFAIEASAGGCNYINDYLFSGRGNIDSVMYNFDFWIWRTEEVKELVLWIKNYNQTKPDSEKIRFYGFDMQNFYSPIRYLNDYLKSKNEIKYQDFEMNVRPLLSKSDLCIKELLKDKKTKFSDTLANINDYLKKWIIENKVYLESKYSVNQYERLAYSIENYNQALKQFDHYYTRDSCMASNIMRIRDVENSKIFVWAHNIHVNSTYSNSVPTAVDIGIPMGGYIEKVLGSKYYSIGFVFNHGSFQALTKSAVIKKRLFKKTEFYKEVKECFVPENRSNTLTNALSEAKISALYIDIDASTNSLFTTAQHTYEVGALFYNYKSDTKEIIVKKQFDGLIYIDKTTRAIPIKYL
jgi:erythromycin esterase